jgi:hypothetical protein
MARMTLEKFAAGVAAAAGPRLVTLLLYGSAVRAATPPAAGANTLLLVDTVDDDLFERLTPPVRGWTAAGHPAPLILTAREWRDSADAFPIEYEDIREAHRILAGRDPWEGGQGVVVRRDHVRRQLEHELMGKLVHLRQAYAAYWHDRARLAAVIAGTCAGFFTMLRAVLRYAGRTPPAMPADLLRDAAAAVGFSAAELERLAVAASRDTPVTVAPDDPLPAAYLHAVARTAEHVHRLERTDS